MKIPAISILFVIGLTSTSLSAAVIETAESGFTSRSSVEINASANDVYNTLLQPGSWWNNDHTFSGNAENMTLTAKIGGCLCEQLDQGGFVEHLHVAYVHPGKLLRLRGALGPLQSLGVQGSMTWSITPSENNHAMVQFEYVVGGHSPDGLNIWADPVDFVVSEQLKRLKLLIEQGSVN